jgi:hypothetical protein
MILRNIDASAGDFTLRYKAVAIKKSSCLVGVLLALSACTAKPPQYESRELPLPAPTSRTVESVSTTPDSIPIEASFIDDFDRPDTTGQLDNGWQLRGAPIGDSPLPPATDGYLRDGHFTYDGKSDVMALRQFRAPVRTIGAEGTFRRSNDANSDTSMAIGMAGDVNVADNVVLLVADRTTWQVKSRLANGRFKTVATGGFAPPLERDRPYRFALSCTGDHVSVAGPGLSISKPLVVPIPLGAFGFWREYPTRTPAGEVFDFDKVWALEDGQPALPSMTASPDSGH